MTGDNNNRTAAFADHRSFCFPAPPPRVASVPINQSHSLITVSRLRLIHQTDPIKLLETKVEIEHTCGVNTAVWQWQI